MEKTLACGYEWVVDYWQWMRQTQEPGVKRKTTTTTYKTLITDRSGTLKAVTTLDYFERKLDDKRRLTIPAELRSEFVGGVVITRGFQDYLHMYPRLVWDNDVEPALGGSILDEQVADLNVQFREGKQSAELDEKQGRITIEQHLLDYAGIDKGIVAVRAGKYWRLKHA